MLVFAHTGIALGAAAVAAGAIDRCNARHGAPASWFAALGRHVDMRLLIIGSMLPDIIDKPVGLYLLRDIFANGRIFAHTLLFLLLIAAAGFCMYARGRQAWLLTLSAGTFVHLALDGMWRTPKTLLWPLFGLTFERGDVTRWAPNILEGLLTNPAVYLPEIAGFLVLAWFGLVLLSRRRVAVFLRYGQVT